MVQEKRFLLTEQLSQLSDLNEDCMHAAQVAEEILADTARKPNEGMYLVAATETIEFRSDTLNEQLETMLKQMQRVDPFVGAQFASADLTEIACIFKSVGAIFTAHTPSLSKPELKDKNSVQQALPQIRFTVKLK
jgi:chaperonin cofactor prefoldin